MPLPKKSAVILDGNALAEKVLLETRRKIVDNNLTPGLAALLVGEDPASLLYLKLKEAAAGKVGIEFHKYFGSAQCYDDMDEAELSESIEFLNRDPQIDGIILQLPLPAGFDQDKMIKLISPAKDVDGFNGGKIIPPTIASIIELIKATGEEVSEKDALIIGKSDIFTHGIEKFLAQELAIKSVAIEHAVPKNCADYDLVIIALGQAGALKKTDIKDGAIIIDVGINVEAGRTVGDADPSCQERAGFISPVPGGVGPLTVACLMRNTVELALKK